MVTASCSNAYLDQHTGVAGPWKPPMVILRPLSFAKAVNWSMMFTRLALSIISSSSVVLFMWSEFLQSKSPIQLIKQCVFLAMDFLVITASSSWTWCIEGQNALFSCVSPILKSRSESSFCSLGIALKNALSIDLLPKKASVSREVFVFKSYLLRWVRYAIESIWWILLMSVQHRALR